VLLDERGREVSSEDIARMIAAAGDDGVPLTFCIGGPFGHGAAVAERADASIRLSRCVGCVWDGAGWGERLRCDDDGGDGGVAS
jgi:hypothetical protein